MTATLDKNFAHRIEDAHVDVLFRNSTVTRNFLVKQIFDRFIEVTREEEPDVVQWLNIDDISSIATTKTELENK